MLLVWWGKKNSLSTFLKLYFVLYVHLSKKAMSSFCRHPSLTRKPAFVAEISKWHKFMLNQLLSDNCCLLLLSSKNQMCPNIGSPALKVLPDVLLVLVALLLPEPRYFVLQLDDGPLYLVVLTDQSHPAVEGQMLSSRPDIDAYAPWRWRNWNI